ncbi:DNA-directed RNA polymerase beta subunit [Bacillus phage AR9]|uniref:DNA-directed RNA polymerase beta subunit n=2 Tax=Bacillus phage PBS1 TaxID=10683 RepID=A0A172JI16_BPPB1|nr:polymerase [Bacillus phage AR9]YP_009664502.1 polymerase [Bacillus phage PBS1]7S00_c Chain c, DNA-directed RNA polymerase beta subunit [Bacillus phage AR9]7S00_e Chain e, DNA-directed RNA polymerase beta subunit [Bacillus phage AR9]7S01_c Chain c, DNA-directed RNA polymerase beta subunit [Bacillus phage AR9]7UM0_c Chain c, DNA-directed RNA polymerase beta subunit [Bacillus phage AR9]7UM1_c Chain c, DNA-directed RNA polymerase beta subunit [Bacillus phage AR9]AMS01189.1 DNA-directed RNA po
MISNFRKFHGNKNQEKFNENLILNKENESILNYLDPICKTLEIIPEITYLGSSVEPINKVYKFNKEEKTSDIERSELQLIKMSFLIEKDDKKEEINKFIYFPKLIDSQYFIINGNRYYPIYQLLDSGTYRTNKALTLKTLLMPIVLREKKETFDDINGETHTMLNVDLDLFKSKVPFLIYFFSKFGFEGTLEYFGLQDLIHVLMKEDLDQLDEDEINDNVIFMITKNISLVVDKNFFSNKNNQIIIATLLNCFNTRIKIDKIYEKDYWVKKLGGYFTTNNSNKQEKGEGIILSFERILDEWTKKILRTEEKNKEDIYSVVRWMINNYLALVKQDNMNLANKRIRLYEYLLHPLLIKFSKGTYRVLNNRNSNKFEKIKTIFSNIQEGFLVKKIINNELLRYDNSVNSISLFTLILRYTQSGPQSPFSSNSTNNKLRGLHPSYLGRLGLTSTSAGDPGASGSLTPFLELPENSYMHFTEEPEINLNIDDISIDEVIES